MTDYLEVSETCDGPYVKFLYIHSHRTQSCRTVVNRIVCNQWVCADNCADAVDRLLITLTTCLMYKNVTFGPSQLPESKVVWLIKWCKIFKSSPSPGFTFSAFPFICHNYFVNIHLFHI